MNEILIDQSNFEQYFFDIRKHKPQKGQVMAIYTAIAELVEGDLKRDLIYLLCMTSKVKECVTLLRKMGWATEEDAIRVLREMCQDLKNGMSGKEVEAKPYEYKLEAFYYTKREFVPEGDRHWSVMEIMNLDQHLEKVERSEKGVIKSRLVKPKEIEEDNDI